MKRALVLLSLPIVLGAVACGLFDSAAEGIWINIPTQTFDFSLNVSESLPEEFKGQTTIPDGINVQQTFDVEVPPQQVDISNQGDLKKYIEAGKVKSVEITAITYTLTLNSLNFALPQVEIYVDSFDATGFSATSKQVATIPSIQAKFTGEGNVQFTATGRKDLSTALMSYKFSLLSKTTITIDTNVTRTLPDGMLVGQIAVSARFSVDPI